MWIFLGAGAYLVHQVFGGDSSTVEDLYSRGFFVAFRWVWDHTLGYSPVPLIYVLVAAVAAWIVIRTVRHFASRRAKPRGSTPDRQPGTPVPKARMTGTSILAKAGRAAILLGGLLGLLVFLFYVLWGFNYDRVRLGLQIGLEVKPVDAPTLKAEADRTEQALSERRALIPGSTAAVIGPWALPRDLESGIRRSLVKILSDFGYPVAGRARVRPLWPGAWLMRFASTGFYFPYLAEGYIAANLTPAEKPFVMAHEMVHVYGIADEGAANFLGYLACESSTDPFIRYSGELAYWQYVFPELAKVSRDDAKTLAGRVPPGVRADLRAIYENWERYRGRLQETAQRVYGQYLKSQGVEEGLKSYDRFVALVVAWRSVSK